MTLPEDDESTFDLFVEWLYHQQYHLPPLLKADVKCKDRYMQAFQLYVLADKYGVRRLKSLIVSQIYTAIKKDRNSPACTSILYAYKNTSQNSTLRNLIAGSLASVCSFNPNWLEQKSSQKFLRGHADITTDVLVSLAKHMQIQGSPFDGEMPEDYKEKEPEVGNGK